ncbi:MAG: peptidase U32 family protein [Christensenellales bacterium]
MKTMPSLLAPAGNMRALQTALRFGADAVYCGAKQYGLRAQAGNFDEKQLEQAVTLAHAAGAQVNLTLNIFAFDGDLDGMVRTAKAARDMGVDAAIISDLGAIARIAREALDRYYVSTQASTTNSESARVYALGAKRVVLAREMTFDQIEAMSAAVGDEIEWNRSFTARVHVVFGAVHAVQLPDGAECEPRRVQPAVPMDIHPA